MTHHKYGQYSMWILRLVIGFPACKSRGAEKYVKIVAKPSGMSATSIFSGNLSLILSNR
jgi:hypothetical protein